MKKLLILLLAGFMLQVGPAQAIVHPAPTAHTLLLILPGDDYLPLAEEIAASEGLPLVQSWEDALSQDPEILLWVVSPAQLSDVGIARAGLALKQRASLPMIGIFTGATQEQARQLWLRGQGIRNQAGLQSQARLFAASGEHPTAGAPQAVLTDYRSSPPQTAAMDRLSLTRALQQADYLTFTGHGSDDYLRIDPDTTFSAADLPALPPLIVGTSSCQTLRLWLDDSIALGFIHQGAVAYAGFVYSPMTGYLIGANGLPFRYTWPEFPIGEVVALQTRGSLQGFANFPFYYLLGDPRISLQSEPPYQVTQDEVRGGTRELTLQGAPQGLIPIRVKNGGAYSFVEVPGWAATADGDPFFNARIQAASRGGEKYILVQHPGGDLHLRLSEAPPWHWRWTHPFLSAFDHVVLFTPLNGGGGLMVGLGLLAVLGTGLRYRRLVRRSEKEYRQAVLIALLVALSVTAAFGLYQSLRLPHVVISTKPMAFNAAWLVGVFLLTASGIALFEGSRSGGGRLLGLCVAVSPALLPAVFGLAAMAGYNGIAAQQVEAGLYNLRLGSLPLIAAGVWLLALWIGLKVIKLLQVLYVSKKS